MQELGRAARAFCSALLTALPLCVQASETKPPARVSRPAQQQNFLGKWELDDARSRIADPAAVQGNQWRLYAADGDRVKVTWGDASGERGTYSAKCDGTPELAGAGRIRCWQAGPRVIEGEQLDTSDPMHRYYRRVVSRDEKTLTIFWYADVERRLSKDRFVYVKR